MVLATQVLIVNLNLCCTRHVLSFGCEALNINQRDFAKLEKTQGSVIKQFCGLDKRHHHTYLVQALGIEKVQDVISRATISLFSSIFKRDSPTRQLGLYLVSLLICNNIIVPGTIVDRICKMGLSPVNVMLSYREIRKSKAENGIIDSMRHLLFDNHFDDRRSAEHNLLSMLCRAF